MLPSSASSRASASSSGLAHLDAAAGQIPARHVAVTDQEDAAGLVDHQRPHPERHAAAEAPIEMHGTPDRRLEPAAQPRQRRLRLRATGASRGGTCRIHVCLCAAGTARSVEAHGPPRGDTFPPAHAGQLIVDGSVITDLSRVFAPGLWTSPIYPQYVVILYKRSNSQDDR